MKRTVSIIVLLIMLGITVFSALPVSAAEPEYQKIDFTKLNFIIKNWDTSKEVSASDYAKLFTTTVTADSLVSSATPQNAPNASDVDSNAKAYFSTLYPITADSSYEMTLKAKNNRTGGYCGIIFATSKDKRPYFVYGALNNGSDGDKTKSELRACYAYHAKTNKGIGRMSETYSRPVLELDQNGYATYKIVYEGYTATVYAKTSDGWTQITFGSNMQNFQLPIGSWVAVGVYNRHGNNQNSGGELQERTVNMTDAQTKVIKMGEVKKPVITFKSNGGSGTMDNIVVDGSTFKLPECLFTAPEGKEFRGWAISYNGEIIRHHEYSVDDDLTLYAIWRYVKYPITYHANDGSGMLDEVTTNSSILMLPEYTMHIPEGKVFKGWSLTPDGEVITETSVNVTGALNFYAIWGVKGEENKPDNNVNNNENNEGQQTEKPTEKPTENLTEKATEAPAVTDGGAKTEEGGCGGVIGGGAVAIAAVMAFGMGISSKKKKD